MSHNNQGRAVSSLACLYIFRMLGLFMVLPVLALSADDYAYSSVLLLGVALGIYGLSQALLQIPFGLLSDRFGRKPLIFIGLILFALGSLVAATADSVYGLIAGRALQGAGAIAGVIMAMVGDLTTAENRTKAMASIGASIGIAFALSLVLGPVIASVELFDVSGVRMIFWMAVLLSIIGVGVLVWMVPNNEVNSTPRSTSRLGITQLMMVLRNRQCRLLYVGVFVLHYALMALFIAVPLVLDSIGLTRGSHAWIYLGVMFASFVVMIPLMIVGEKKRVVKPIFRGAIAVVLLALLLFVALPSTLLSVIIALGIFFIGFNYLEANLPSLLSKLLPQESRGAGSGVFATCQFLGAALGGIVSGALYSQWGVLATFSVAMVMLLVWLIVVAAMTVPYKQQS